MTQAIQAPTYRWRVKVEGHIKCLLSRYTVECDAPTAIDAAYIACGFVCFRVEGHHDRNSFTAQEVQLVGMDEPDLSEGHAHFDPDDSYRRSGREKFLPRVETQ